MSKQFSFTDEEFIAVVNVVLKLETPGDIQFSSLSSMDDVIDSNRLDSLGMMVFFVWLSDMFGIADEGVTAFIDRETELASFTGDKGNGFSVTELKDFIVTNQTKCFTYTESLEFAQQCS